MNRQDAIELDEIEIEERKGAPAPSAEIGISGQEEEEKNISNAENLLCKYKNIKFKSRLFKGTRN